MFNKITLLASLLFFFSSANLLANSKMENSIPITNGNHTDSYHEHRSIADLKTAPALKISTNHVLLSKKTKVIEPSFKNYIVPGAVGLILILGFSSYWLIYRRKYIHTKET